MGEFLCSSISKTKNFERNYKGMNYLAEELLSMIFQFLSLADLSTLRLTCKKFNRTMQSNCMNKKWREELILFHPNLLINLKSSRRIMAFFEYFITLRDLETLFSRINEELKQDLRQFINDSKKFSWLEKIKLINDPFHQISLLKQGRYLPVYCIKQICKKVLPILMEEPNVIYTKSPITVVGNICGHLGSLLKILETKGMPDSSRYLFLGGYVNRSCFSLETITLLLLLKTLYPQNVLLLRGYHETKQITSVYGFLDECLDKYGDYYAWSLFSSVFEYFPISAVIDNEIFCVHAGLSPEIKTVEQISKLKRNEEIPNCGPLSDFINTSIENTTGWQSINCGPGFTQGIDITKEWNQKNRFKLIIRSRELLMMGVKWMHDNQICSVWSAANYCGRCGNKGGVLSIKESGEYER